MFACVVKKNLWYIVNKQANKSLNVLEFSLKFFQEQLNWMFIFLIYRYGIFVDSSDEHHSITTYIN